jgi:hypothetical protein
MRIRTVGAMALSLAIVGCDEKQKDSDTVQREQQEALLAEGTSQVGMPNIKNFRERKILKDIYEKRDQEGFVTYTYLFSEQTGKFTFVGQSIGYGISASTQFTNPSKVTQFGTPGNAGYGGQVIPQADPNGLFSPSSAEGTWVQLKDPNSSEVKVCYFEQRVAVLPFKLPDAVVMK